MTLMQMPPNANDDALAMTPQAIGDVRIDVCSEAMQFLHQMRTERGERGPDSARIAEVLRQIDTSGTYEHTIEELTFGAKVAWRNTPRCLGKFYWSALQLIDMRHLDSADDIFEALVAHQRTAFNGGRIKLLMTVFAAAAPGADGIRIWNSQLVRYAGYRNDDGTVTGDPSAVEFTAVVMALGWRPRERGQFDVLPIVIQMPGAAPRLYELPPDAIHEVEISHPTVPGIAELGLRWYAFPSISDQRLEIGGVSYPAAPFSAWYTGTEIGARDLTDANRYNKLSEVARVLGLDTGSDRTLWKDWSMLHLTSAVMHSYDEAGVSLIDHHFAAKQFVRHETRESEAGRITPAHYDLIVAPTGGSATPLWGRHYEPTILRPNFFAQPMPWRSATPNPAGQCPVAHA